MTFENDTVRCKERNNQGNSSFIPIKNSYGGIPQNLLTNLIGFISLLLLFLLLRKSAWKIVNKIVKKDGKLLKWYHVFFAQISSFGLSSANSGSQSNAAVQSNEVVIQGENGQLRADEDFTNINNIDPGDEEEKEQDPDRIADANDIRSGEISAIRSAEEETEPDRGSLAPPTENGSIAKKRILNRQNTLTSGHMTFRQWFVSIFTLEDDEIKLRCGNDAVQYLRFQRYVIMYLSVVTILCTCVILPINFQGTLQGDVNSFEHTTMVNLSSESPLIWVHVAFAFIFFPLAIVLMRKFSVPLEFQDASMEVTKTLMIDKVPKNQCDISTIHQYMRETHPNEEVTDITLAYDVNKLLTIEADLTDVQYAREFCEMNPDQNVQLYPVVCSRCCFCFCVCCVNKVDGMDYYWSEEARLDKELDEEREKSLETPLGIIFITFKTLNMSKHVFDCYQKSVFQKKPRKLQLTSLSEQLKVFDWQVNFATSPDDIYWENLSKSRRYLLIKKIIINFFLFIVAFFLTTPEVLITQTNIIISFIKNETNINTTSTEDLILPSWMVSFLPTVLLITFTNLLPLLVAWSDRFLGHWTRSVENHAIMKKTFWFLLFMVIFVPTLGLSTASEAIKFVVSENNNDTYRWDCFFLPDSGAFFVNYIITAALVGAGFDLIRLPELLWYSVQVCYSKSEADNPAIRSRIKYEFRFGEQYAKSMLVFCMTMMYSLSCPLITPFGILFFVTRHYVDRHNLLFAYKPSKINKKVHATAISFVILSVVVLQFFMMVFIIIRFGTYDKLMAKVMIGIFLISCNVFSAQLWADTCKKFSPIEYKQKPYFRDSKKEDKYVYLPKVLIGKAHALPGSPDSSRNYGHA